MNWHGLLTNNRNKKENNKMETKKENNKIILIFSEEEAWHFGKIMPITTAAFYKSNH